MLVVLVPLRLDDGGFAPFAIGAVFLGGGPGRGGRQPGAGPLPGTAAAAFFPCASRWPRPSSIAIAFAGRMRPYAVAALAILAAISFGAFYTPAMALVSDRSEAPGLSQAIGFGIMNTAWALGNMTGPSLVGMLADAAGDAAPLPARRGALPDHADRDGNRSSTQRRVQWP